ncbi:solute carrier family 32 (vesicular inhibitory amino acid transporter) [Cryptococcus neoformans Tu259-1]|uniref:Solute carrier family 32 (Vesicular inhibitory amino acid transporter) n=1 Tax=Cryptococcus neoformans Tu259-1 TaxID=1230072 RepID=A0A854Q983_CRYNE|nr:solute carrier family 32 (vesicular inhibitory amino acid transporter) [Cryptococcus neoformans var. grubii Tu259-1]
MAANSIASGHHCSLCRYRCCFAGFRTCDGLFGKFFSVFDLYHLASPILHPPVPHSPSVLSPIAPFTHILTDCPLATHVKMDQRQIYEYDTLGIGNRQYGADDSRDCMGVPARKWA